ncbi:virginiamycin B lyase family protein [Kribbella jiaozuonensis]|uniref:Virginiamycin B lyase n=1 Tax=Kribbella jiaozuonensis TaxID=2575441 RepID=A0A4U3LPR6_9ACTN|nr:virginiamycin B lyase [Kribbella jiaozuonensis]TKK77861.1 virginiamycin B lyase [Kribbella jiaozuonensis]
MSVTEYAVGDGPYGVAIAGGEVWTTLVHAGRVATASGRQFDLDAPQSRPSVIVDGPDDAVWFTRNGDDRVGRIGYDGVVSAVDVAGAPYGLCVGSDGALWCTLMSADAVARVTVDGEVTTYPIGTSGAFPAMITSYGDELWFTLNQANAIGRMTLDGAVTTYPLPTESAGPVGISGVWFVEILADRVGRITADGKIEEFALPAGSKPHAVAGAADGGCWVSLWGAGAVARLDAEGNITDRHDLGEGSEPHGLVVDGESVWVALEKGSLAHIQP